MDAVVDGGAPEVEAGEGEGQGLDPWRNNREFDIAIEGLREAWGTVQQRKSAGSTQVSCILLYRFYIILFCVSYIDIYTLYVTGGAGWARYGYFCPKSVQDCH